MKAILLCVAFEVASGIAFAQGAADPMAHLRACSIIKEDAERLECLDRLSRDIAAPDRAARAGDNWIISETTSPVNYTPTVTATASSRGSSDEPMQLAIHCRGGRTELVVSGPAVSRSSPDYSITYRVNNDHPVQLAARSPSFGTGAAFTGDIVRLLQSLPEDGHIAVRIIARSGVAQDGLFLLGGLKTAREKLAAACRWPHAVAGPRN
jgi:hypothetical protein